MPPSTTHDPRRAVMRWVMILFYAGAGVFHLVSPGGFAQILPTWVPYPAAVIAVTGICELLGAAGLAIPRLRWWAGVMLAAYAVGVFPANVHHAFENIAIGGVRLSWWYHGPRLLFQPVLVWWALYCAGVTDWPWRSRTNI